MRPRPVELDERPGGAGRSAGCADEDGVARNRPWIGGAVANTEEIVRLMADVALDGGLVVERRAGLAALEVAREIQAVLMAQLENNLGHVLLWEQFQRTPGDLAMALAGVLDSLMRKDPGLADWLEKALGRYRCESAPKGGQ